jgi:hypothetical protein
MTTTWNPDKKPGNHEPNNTSPDDFRPGRSAKAGDDRNFATRLLLAVSVLKQGPKRRWSGFPALRRVRALDATATATTPTAAASPVKKTPEASANFTFSDPGSGVSFLYPRKFALTSGDKARPQFAPLGDAAMNFVQPGGVAIATVEMPGGSYPGTDFASAFFNVNVNRNLSEQECGHFAFVDSHNVNGAPVDVEKAKIGSTDMETTSDFSASAMTQTETQYYHSYQNGACYEYVLGLRTEGFATEGGIDRQPRQVFQLEKILASVKIKPVETEHGADPSIATIAAGKE